MKKILLINQHNLNLNFLIIPFFYAVLVITFLYFRIENQVMKDANFSILENYYFLYDETLTGISLSFLWAFLDAFVVYTILAFIIEMFIGNKNKQLITEVSSNS